jgi:hypothetical protein
MFISKLSPALKTIAAGNQLLSAGKRDYAAANAICLE